MLPRSKLTGSNVTMSKKTADVLPLARPSLGEDEIQEVVEILRSGSIGSGPQVRRFEEDFARYVDTPHAVAVASCTAGLQIALLAHGIGAGDEVVTSAMTWPSTANAIELVGARCVFADVDPGTLQITPESVESVLTDRTRAVLPVHFAGQSCELDGLAKLASRDDLVLIEDAAHAVGTEFRGRRIGGGGSTACFSFHPAKNLTTADGGMVTTGDAEVAKRLRLLRSHGVDREPDDRHATPGAAGYDTVLPGFKYTLSDLQATLGIGQLRRLDEFIATRTRLAALYLDRLAGVDIVSCRSQPDHTTRHAWHLFVITLDLERMRCDRDGFMARLAERGITTGLHFSAVHLHRYYRERYGHAPGDLPHTEWASQRVVSLPLFSEMAEAEVSRVCDAIEDVAREVGR